PITVTPKVTLTIQPPALPVCAGGAPIQIQASHPACFSGGPYISATGLFTPPALPGQYIIQSAFPCNGPPDCISSAELVISVLPVTVVTLSGPSPLCVDGAPVNFTANPTGGVWLPAPGLTDVNLGTFDPALAGPGMHILAHQFNASNGCVSQPSISVEVVDVPTVTAPDTLRTCHIPQGVDLLLLGGNSFSFNPSGGSFTWTGTGVDPQTGIFTSSGLDTITINVAYTLQPGPPGCTSSETFELIISPFVNAVAGADDEVCQNTNNGQYMLNANPAGGSWSGTSVDPQTGIVNLLSVPTGVPLVYVYTLQEGTPCVSRDTTILIVFPGDGVQTPPLAYVCETELSFTLPSGIPVNGDWVGPFENNGIVDVSQLDTGLAYVYTYTVPGLPAACASAELELYVLAEPDGGFEYSDDTLCVGSIGFFSAHDTVGVLYAWDFGDGTSSTLPNPEHTWTSSGDYLVRLTVFLPDPLAPGQFVCINGSQTTIRVVAPPLLQIALSPDTICPYEGVAFENLSTGEAVSGFFWDFGNNQTYVGFEPGDSIYYAPGIEDTLYTITLTVSGACPDAVASVNLLVHPLPYLSLVPSLDNTCSGDTLTFSVGFTGGSIFNITFSAHDTATTGLPLPALTFFTPNDSTQLTVVAVVAGENQCAATTDTAIIQILPNEANAFCDLNVPVICVGDTLIITNGATPLDAAVSYDFGDGTTSNDPNPRKVYSQAGTYKIRQTARTFCGYDFVDRWIQVNPAPAAGFAHDAYRCVGDSMHFWLTVDSLARTVDWDFGFGNVSTAFSPLAAFPQSGIFPVTLTITLDSSGCDASVTELVEIKANPVAQFTASDTLACGRLETTLLASPAGSQYNYGWFASNGNTAAGNPANFVFSDSGSYSVRLLVQDLWGCQDDTSLFIFRVFPVPNSNFSMNLNWHCGLPANVVLNEQASADALGFEWLFPDGSSSTSNNTAHTFLQAGDFPIRLRVSNLYGCSDDTIRVFRVFEQPVANFTITDPAPCQFSILEIENQSEYANAWLWTFHYGDTSRLETPRYAFPQPGVFDISLIAMRDSFC
ncbi:MAG: PKD domain-containing protein, partial [Saprospiraceae bacterium]|nr:PKD domain-containing protein [Saprospiraceae bacterium]